MIKSVLSGSLIVSSLFVLAGCGGDNLPKLGEDCNISDSNISTEIPDNIIPFTLDDIKGKTFYWSWKATNSDTTAYIKMSFSTDGERMNGKISECDQNNECTDGNKESDVIIDDGKIYLDEISDEKWHALIKKYTNGYHVYERHSNDGTSGYRCWFLDKPSNYPEDL